METFGQKVRQAVESNGLPLADVAQATGLDVEHLEALERDDFGALPSDEIVRQALRSLARLIDVDPDAVIADYDLERQRWLAGEPLAVEPSPRNSGGKRRIAIVATALLALILIAVLFFSRSSTAPRPAQPAVARQAMPSKAAPTETAAPKTREVSPPTAAAVAPTAKLPKPPDRATPGPALKPPAHSSALSIRESGVGKDVVNHELVAETARFSEGERVWFWTLIEGATAGESVDHVWLHEGREVLRVPMTVGGARWRGRSYKYLTPGSKGKWVVEARDEAGRVLARREFLCSPHN